MPELKTNVLYYGDNLKMLRERIPSESVDLIYLDPPFNSKADYNVLFREPTGERSAAQLRAFSDSWHWDTAAEQVYQEIITKAPLKVSKAIEALRAFIGSNDVMAYLVMMTVRLVELHRVLKPTGSLYLHCDPTASHYLKIILDTIFGPINFRNEIVWKRSSAHSDTRQGMRRYGRIHDVLLFYAKTQDHLWHPLYATYASDYLESEYRHVTAHGRRYKETDVTAAKPGGDTEYEWRVKKSRAMGARYEADIDDEYLHPKAGVEYKGVAPYKGRYWGYSKANLLEFARDGRLIHRETGMPRLMQFADEMPGVPLQDLWNDISPAMGGEDQGYATQKPLALLERIIGASSNPGDVVLDPFCGCGTAVVAAQKLGRRWIGIDITHLAITVMKQRLQDSFPGLQYEVIGQPEDLEGAKTLARQDRYQFQWWALSLVGAQPRSEERKKGADAGVDGVIAFQDDAQGKALRVVVQVKSGGVGVKDIRDLKGVVDERDLGLFITLEPPTQPMRTEAVSAGFHSSPLWERRFPRIQVMTIDELLDGQQPDLPRSGRLPGFAKAPRVKRDLRLPMDLRSGTS